MALQHFEILLGSTKQGHKAMTWRTHSHLSSVRIFGNKDETLVLRNFDMFKSSSSSSVSSSSQQPRSISMSGSLVLSTRTPSSHVFPAIPRAPTHRVTQSSMLGLSRCNIMFDVLLGRPTSDRNTMGSLNLDCFIISVCINNSFSNRHPFPLSRGTTHWPNLQLGRQL